MYVKCHKLFEIGCGAILNKIYYYYYITLLLLPALHDHTQDVFVVVG